jgi:hypothetical protein
LDSNSGLWNAGVTNVKCVRFRLEAESIPSKTFTGFDPAEFLGFDPRLRGWSSYFRIGTVCEAHRNILSHIHHRMRQWLCSKFKLQGQGIRRSPDQCLHQELGLYPMQRAWRQRLVYVRVCTAFLQELSGSHVRETRKALSPRSGPGDGAADRALDRQWSCLGDQ